MPHSFSGLMSTLRERLANRPDSEHEMSLNRIAFCAIVLVYLIISTMSGVSDARRVLVATSRGFEIYTLLAIGIFLHILWKPGTSPVRRILAIALDLGMKAWVLHEGGALTAFLYPLFLWTIFGNGFRFGVSYLFIASGIGTASFAAVVLTTPFWSEHAAMSFGFWLGLLVLPAYVSILIRKLSDAKKQAEQASRAKTMFLASVSHELRTPLNAIIGLSALMEATRLSRDQRDMMATIGQSGRSLLNMINSLLDFSRLEMGRMPLKRDELDLLKLVGEVRNMLSVQANAKGIRLTLFIAPGVPRFIQASRRHIEEVLVNVTSNAVKFTEEGFVQIALRAQPAQGKGWLVTFEVSDTGIGIAPEAQSRIFESFTQADETILDRFGGSGLGLAISRQLCEAHGGAISVCSRTGSGSTFTFSFLVEPSAHQVEEPLPAAVLVGDTGEIEPALRAQSVDIAGVLSPAEAAKLMKRGRTDGRLPIVIAQRAALGDLESFPGFAAGKSEIGGSTPVILLAESEEEIEAAKRSGNFFAAVLRSSGPEAIVSCMRAADVTELHSASGEPAGEVRRPTRALSVLIAEDNIVNQRVLSKIIERAGHKPTIAANGEKALDLLVEKTFDIVLMDVNMPVINGIEATKLYRFGALGQPHVPIVALTADATPEAAARCKAAGMDDILTKPIEPRVLIEAIERLVVGNTPASDAGAERSDEEAPEDVAVESESAGAPIDVEALDSLERLGGDEFVETIVNDFISDAVDVLKELSQAVAQGDVEHFRDRAHALRSSAANVGARRVYQTCLQWREIEPHELAHNGEIYVRQLEGEFVKAREALKTFTGQD